MSAAPALLDAPMRDAAGFAAQTGATRAQLRDMEAYRALLADWNQRMSLVSEASLGEFWPRHALDSAQLLAVAPEARVWVDIGAGAGLPGLVLAILLKGAPGARVHLVESQAKKCRFLEVVTEALALPADVLNVRAESLALKADVVTARAVAPLTRLLGFAEPFMAKGAVGLFLKGQGADAEIAEARKSWRFTCNVTPSQSDPGGRILRIEGLARGR
ncbi:MAG TPA: 16S rRNA (guanine(527)-N(7))-methyltransferase RsmG [Caulobacteraceae bacterium]|jgi:16S rRNA (guanine527-N7)-methyltransferase|nr:16S rRNA (guanine(527)-N(7))-methyltransferase RsmG [Caulobacteraceae bacterium]